MDTAPQTVYPNLVLVARQSNRGETLDVDARLLNGYIEADGDQLAAYKRPGFLRYPEPVGVNLPGRGCYNWNNNIITIGGSNFYVNGVFVGNVANNGKYDFTPIQSTPAVLFLKNTTNAYIYNPVGPTLTPVAGGYPASTVPGLAYLDGTLYVASVPNDIWGSNFNDPTTWSALNVIKAQIEPDNVVAIAKQLTYVVVFKQWTTEIFYDAANPTASPLGSLQAAMFTQGCLDGRTVQSVEGSLFWLSSAKTGSATVHLMEGVKARKISTPAVERLLQAGNSIGPLSWSFRESGHLFYGLTLPLSDLTLVYDQTSDSWYRWADVNGEVLPFIDSTFITVPVTGQRLSLLQGSARTTLFYPSYTAGHDNLIGTEPEVFDWDLYTPSYDGGTKRKKFLKRMDFLTDQNSLGTLQIRHSDDDYQTWSNFREVDLGTKRPNITDCGTFRKRAFHFRYSEDTPLRLKIGELQLMMGSL